MINQSVNPAEIQIVRGNQPITVKHLIFLLYGQPGICKSSLGFSADEPILLNFDSETALSRTVNRRDAIDVLTVDMLNAEQEHQAELFAKYNTIVIDPVGACLNLMAADIVIKTPKCGRADGSLTLQGFGSLKQRFARWIADLKRLEKDILFISHNKEDKNNDIVFQRPDITGGSKDEVLRLADCVGYLAMNGKNRVLDFNPTEAWFGKNPAQWAPFKVPAIEKSTDFLATLMADAKKSLGKISEASAAVTLQIDDWRAAIATFNTPEDFNRAIPQVKAMAKVLQPQVSKMLIDGAALVSGVQFNKQLKLFEAHPAATEQQTFFQEIFV